MPLRQARSIDELAALVEGHDKVLTHDAPLALALNRRTDSARLGTFATTPKQHAAQGAELPDKRELFHRILHETTLSFKEAATRLNLILSAWEHTGEPDAILRWDRYDAPGTHAILDVLASEDSTYAARQRATLPDGDVAIIDLPSFLPLDKALLPSNAADHDRITLIEPFHEDETTTLPPLRILPNTPGLLATLSETLTPTNAHNIGIVHDLTGPLRPLVETLLDARGIPHQTRTTLNEDAHMRAFLQALRASLTNERLKGRDVRALLATIDAHPSPRYDDQRLATLTTPPHRRLRRFWDALQDATLNDALTAFEGFAQHDIPEARALFEALRVDTEPITRTLLDALEYYLDTFDVEHDHTRDGALLASAHDNAYVDRPLVLHLGLDARWSRPVPSYPWIDHHEHERRDLRRFTLLLQTGHESIHLVQATHQGKPITPCFSLHEIIDDPFETFTDLENQGHAQRHTPPTLTTGETLTTPFPHEPTPEATHEPVRTLSASSLDCLSTCPRDWYMTNLVEPVQRGYFEKGNILHEFAEAYAHQPDTMDIEDPDQLDSLIAFALDELSPFLDPERAPITGTELRIAFRNIARWLDENPPTGEAPSAYTHPEKGPRRNRFAQHLGLDLDAVPTERWFQDEDLGLHGIVDLVHDAHTLVDWKTGKNPDSTRSTIQAARPGTDKDPRHQPLTYLTHLRQHTTPAPLACTIINALANHEDILRGQGRLPDIETTISYHPQSFHEYAATEDAYTHLASSSNVRRRILDPLGPETYKEVLQTNPLPPFEDADNAEDHEIKEKLANRARSIIGDYKYVDDGARSTVRALARLRDDALYEEDLDAFETYVLAMIEKVNEWKRTRFPVDCEDLEDAEHADLILQRLGPEPTNAPMSQP